jgi:hypothetical protein
MQRWPPGGGTSNLPEAWFQIVEMVALATWRKNFKPAESTVLNR